MFAVYAENASGMIRIMETTRLRFVKNVMTMEITPFASDAAGFWRSMKGDILRVSSDLTVMSVTRRNGRKKSSMTTAINRSRFFYGEGLRYMGVELEVDHEDEDVDAGYDAENVLDLVNETQEKIYIKHDGSLNYGFEIVTHPMTLRYHQEDMPWKEVCHLMMQQGYRSHMTDTCGLHVHVNRESLGVGEIEMEATIANILLFLEKFWREMVCFSRRTEGQLERWARRYGLEMQGSDILQKAKNGCYGRYVSLNLENKDTIEFRIFRGTLKDNTILATLELVNEICTVCAQLSEKEMQELSWLDFVKRVSNNTELVQYLKERSLYVNEPVAGEEDL